MTRTRLKVLFLPAWYPSPGTPGEGLFIREHARAVSLLHDVVVLHVLSAEAGAVSDRMDGAIRVIRCEVPVPRGARLIPRPMVALLRDFARIKAASQVVQQLDSEGWRPDLLHAHVYPAALAGLPLARRLAVPIVLTEHWSGFARGMITGAGRIKARAIISRMDAVMPVSRALLADMIPLGLPERSVIVPNAIDTGRFHPAGVGERSGPDARPRILFIGGTDPLKGLQDLALAFNMLLERGHDPVLVFAGGGDPAPVLGRWPWFMREGRNLEMHGRLPHDEIARLMRRAAFIAIPSSVETFCCAAAEAVASGCPVVAFDRGGLPEIVHPGCGRLVPWNSDPALRAASLADAMQDILSHQGAFNADAMAAQARERFGHEAVAAQIDSVYTTVLRDNKRHAVMHACGG